MNNSNLRLAISARSIIHSFIGKIEDDDEIESLGTSQNSEWAPPTNFYHIDVSMQEVPTKGAALYAVDPPKAGGDTIWVNTYAAWEALSDSMQQFLLDKKGVFIGAHRKRSMESYAAAKRHMKWQPRFCRIRQNIH